MLVGLGFLLIFSCLTIAGLDWVGQSLIEGTVSVFFSG